MSYLKYQMKGMQKFLLLALLIVPMALSADELSPTAKKEIDALLVELGTSRCQFYRNGRWFKADKAKEHLQTKLEYLVMKGQVSSSEEFIERAATKSSISGNGYKVQCHGDEEQPSAVWLTEKLHKMRQEQSN